MESEVQKLMCSGVEVWNRVAGVCLRLCRCALKACVGV